MCKLGIGFGGFDWFDDIGVGGFVDIGFDFLGDFWMVV